MNEILISSRRGRLILLVALVSSCGFGSYNDGASPDVTSATSGVPGSGMWWPWTCANGSNPSPASIPRSYTVVGSCGLGGAFALSVDGCEMRGDWTVLGLSEVITNIPSSIPAAGGWEVAGTGGGGRDAGTAGTERDGGGPQWTCDTTALPSGGLNFTCTAGTPATPTCESTLTPVATP